MTPEIAIVLGLLVLATILFARETFSVDVVTLILLFVLAASGILSPKETFSGFSDEIIMILASIFVLNGAMHETRIPDALGSRLLELPGKRRWGFVLALMVLTSFFSAFMNNTTVTALLLPVVLSLARHDTFSPSKLMMPLAFASIMGGTCTLIGTSTNVAVSNAMLNRGLAPLGMFELTPFGLVVVGVGIAYMLLVGLRLLPDNPVEDESGPPSSLREYLSEIVVLPKSQLIGQHVFECDLGRMGFRILRVIRGQTQVMPRRTTQIEAGDILLVEGQVSKLMEVKAAEGIDIRADTKALQETLKSKSLRIGEVILPPQSNLIQRTLKEAGFLQRFGLMVLAIHRQGKTLRDKLSNIRLRLGDVLLVQGPDEGFDRIHSSAHLTLLSDSTAATLGGHRALIVFGSFALAVLAATLRWAPLSVCFLAAALVVILTRCVPMQKVYSFVDMRLLILIGGMTSFGTAMHKTGADAFLAACIIDWLSPLGVMAILAGFSILTILLTQTMSNAAAALVVLPVALETAAKLGVNERTFSIAIMLSASISFLTPLEPACLLVYGPGRYRFGDFLRIGLGLTVLLVIAVLVLVPVLWPLHVER